MKINNNRRRFVSALSYGAFLMNISPFAFAAKDNRPKCLRGEILRNGWRAKWGSSGVTVSSPAYKANQSATGRGVVFTDQISKILGIVAKTQDKSQKLWLYFNAIPRVFRTPSAKYSIRKAKDYGKENSGIYRIPITDGASGLADVRITLRRKGTRGLYSKVEAEEGGGFLLSPKEQQRFLADGLNPLVVEFSADDQVLLRRSFDVNGLLRSLNEAKPNYLAQKKRYDARICKTMCFLTTAACGGIGLSDDCWELTMLRKFRDGYMVSALNGQSEITEYYNMAPQMVEEISGLDNSKILYLTMYWKYILPSALLICFGQNKKAHVHYKALIGWVKRQVKG